MSLARLWPHPSYAEDQPRAHAILALHVLTRGATTGAAAGLGLAAAARALLGRRRGPPAALFLRAAGTGAAAGTALLAVGLAARMWGREDVEWRDRAWRLLENRGQAECDDWTYGGAAAGLAAAVAATGALGRGMAAAGWRGAVGAAGAGSLAGTAGYMAWRYGVHGGRFEEEVEVR